MAAPCAKIQLFGHSFIKRLRDFVGQSSSLRYDMGLAGPPLVQYSGYPGATTTVLRAKLEDVIDFEPDLLILCVGTNDIYDARRTPASVARDIYILVDALLCSCPNAKIIVLQVLHRTPSKVHTRFPVDVDWFNTRVDQLNRLLSGQFNTAQRHYTYFWRLKGFWAPECKSANFSADGCHLSNQGHTRLMSNIRAAVVAVLKGTICNL